MAVEIYDGSMITDIKDFPTDKAYAIAKNICEISTSSSRYTVLEFYSDEAKWSQAIQNEIARQGPNGFKAFVYHPATVNISISHSGNNVIPRPLPSF